MTNADDARALLAECEESLRELAAWMFANARAEGDGVRCTVNADATAAQVRAYLSRPAEPSCSTCSAGLGMHIHPATRQCQGCGLNRSDLHDGKCAACWADRPAEPLTCSLAEALAMAESDSVLLWRDCGERAAVKQTDDGCWAASTTRNAGIYWDDVYMKTRNPHTFIHGGRVYTVAEPVPAKCDEPAAFAVGEQLWINEPRAPRHGWECEVIGLIPAEESQKHYGQPCTRVRYKESGRSDIRADWSLTRTPPAAKCDEGEPADWQCANCDGEGGYEMTPADDGPDYPAVCDACGGTGRTPGPSMAQDEGEPEPLAVEAAVGEQQLGIMGEILAQFKAALPVRDKTSFEEGDHPGVRAYEYNHGLRTGISTLLFVLQVMERQKWFYVYEIDYPEEGGDAFQANTEDDAKRQYNEMTGETDAHLEALEVIPVKVCPCCHRFNDPFDDDGKLPAADAPPATDALLAAMADEVAAQAEAAGIVPPAPAQEVAGG